MDSTCGYDPTLPLDLEGSTNPNVLHEVTFGSYMEYPDGSVPMVVKTNSGRMSPVRGRTVKEYDQQLSELKKENFSLKLRIYFLEERMQQKCGDNDVFKMNIELKVELESVKNELSDKQELLKKASMAMEMMSKQHDVEISEIRSRVEEENKNNIKQLTDNLNEKQQELDQADRALEGAAREVKDLQTQIEDSQTLYAELSHKTEIQIQDLKDALAAKESFIGNLETDKRNQDDILQKLREAKDEADNKLEQMVKEASRKDRDIEDTVDDQSQNLEKLKTDIDQYKQQLTKKDRMIRKLEDVLRTAARDKKELETKVKEMEDILDERQKKMHIRDKALVGLRSLAIEKTKEVEDVTQRLEDKEVELKTLQKEHKDMKLEKSKALEQKHEEVNYLEEKALATQAHLKEQETELEKLMRTLGKKEGELESFRDLLTKAENALKQSEDAVDGLQKQLKKDIGPASHSKHYQTLYEDAQKQVKGKDELVKSLTESLQDKDKQIQYCMGLSTSTKEEKKKSADMWMKELQEKLREKNQALEDATAEKYKILDEKDGEIRQLKQQIREKDRDLDRANQTLLSSEETIDGLEKECSEKDTNMQQLINSLKSSQRSFEDALDSHARVLGEKDIMIKRLQNTLADKERTIEASQYTGTSSNEELNRIKKQLKEKDNLIQELMAEQSKATVANAEALNNMMKKLKCKDEDMRELMERSNKGMLDLQKEILQLQADLKRKQLHSKSSEDQICDLEQEHRLAVEKLAAALKDKDKTIETLVESGQEKDKLIERLQQYHATSRGTISDNNKLRDNIDQLRHQCNKKQDEIDELKLRLETDGSRSPKGGSYDLASLDELRLNLAVKSEALRAAKQTEEDFREQINALRKQLDTAHQSMKEVHTTDKQVYYMSEKTGGKPQQYREIMHRELIELHRIQEAEKQLLSDLKEKSTYDKSHNLETELAAIQTLRRELEAGIERNNNLQTQLEEQSTKSKSPRKGLSDNLHDGEQFDMKGRFSDNSSCSDTQGTPDSRRSSDGTPRGQDVEFPQNSYSWPLGQNKNKKPQLIKTWSPSSTDSDVQLNRQSLSEMSAPMLRKFIRQMKHQFEKAEKENDELRRKVDGIDSRQIPGRNESDVNSLPVMHLEIERLTKELSTKNEEIRQLKSRIGFAVDSMDLKDLPNLTDLQNENLKLKVQLGNLEELNMLLKKQIALNSQSANSEGFNPELIVQMANEIRNLKTQLDNVSLRYDKCNVSCQTSPWSDAIVTHGQGQRKSSKIPQLQKPAPMKSNSSDRDSPDVLKSLLMEAHSRIQALEAKLEATEGTVRLQTKKMKYYRNLLEEHGLMAKSPLISRCSSESNLVMAVGGKTLSRNNRTLSYDNIPELLTDSTTESTDSEKLKTYGRTDNVHELKEQIAQLKKIMDKYKSVFKAQVTQSDTSVGGICTQTHHDLDDTFIPRQSLHELQCKLSASEENNVYLRQTISDLKLELKKYHDHISVTESGNSQGSPTKHFIESQKLEIMFLRKKLSDTQNSCVQLEGWLNELSDFLNELMYVDDDGNHSSVRGIKQTVDKSRHMIQTMSSTLLENDMTDGSFSITEDNTFYRDTINGSENIRQNVNSLTEELCRKNVEVERLTAELKKRNSKIGQLNLDLHSTQNKASVVNNENIHGSVTSTNSDGNVYCKSSNQLRNAVSPVRSPTSTTSDVRRLSDMSNLNHSGQSIERLRHNTGNSDQSCTSTRSTDHINFTTRTIDSSMRSTGTVDSMSFMTGLHQFGASDFTCTSILGSEERMIINRHDYFDASHTPAYLHDGDSVSFPTLNLEKSQTENGNSKRVSFCDTTRCDSPINNVSILTTRLNALEDLNRTLKDEVNLYEKMCTSMGTQISPQKSVNKSGGDFDKDLLLEHLLEIRALRTKLEKSLDDSDRLREALERDMKKDHLDTGPTSNVYLYSQHQSVVRELQFTIQRLEQELSDKNDLINSVRLRAERDITFSRNRTNGGDVPQDITPTMEKLKQMLKEREEKVGEMKVTLSKSESDMQQLNRCNREKDETIRKLHHQLNQAETSLQARSREQTAIQTLEKLILEKERIIEEKENIIEQKIVIIRGKTQKDSENQNTLALQQRRIEELDKTMSQMRKKLELQEQSLHQQEQKLKEQFEIIQQQDKHILQHTEARKQRDEQIKQLEITINRKQEKVRQLEHTIRSVEEEKQSLEKSCHRREEQCQQREDKLKDLEEQRKTETEKAKKQELNLRKAAKEIRRLNSEIKTLQEQYQENKDLNQTLKLELSVYEKLEKQEGDYDTKGAFDIRDLLTEIRHLRVQLERCIETNSALRQKLEEHLAHQNSPRSHATHVKSQSPARSGTTTGTDATDGQPSPEKTRVHTEHSHSSQLSSIASLSQNSSVSEDHCATHSLDIHTWPGSLLERKVPNDTVVSTQSMPAGPLHRSLYDMPSRDQKYEGNLSYYVDDPPSKLADFTFQSSTTDSDLRNLFAVGKLEDYEKLKKENYESLIVLNGVDARIQERLKMFKSASVSEIIKSIEYSTLKELSMSVENLKICLNEEKSLITCFWATTLPKGDTSGQKMMAENEALRNELFATRTKYELLSKLVHEAEERLHASNRQKQTMEDMLYKQLKRTTKVMTKARTNFEKAQYKDKENIRTIDVDVDDIESSVDLHH